MIDKKYFIKFEKCYLDRRKKVLKMFFYNTTYQLGIQKCTL